MQQKCERCEKQAVITLNYGPHNYCKQHFNHFFERRFKKTVRKHKLFRAGERLLVGVSGGKDSMLSLYLLKKFFFHTNSIQALIIDEGIPGYRDNAIETAVKGCTEWNVPFTVVKFEEEFGITDLQIMRKLSLNSNLGKSCCAFCGPFRRTILNKYAKILGAEKLVTGHNLDDECQSILMNIFINDFVKFERLGAGAGVKRFDGFVPRIKPLYESPEKEIIAYCMLNATPHYSAQCCPFSSKAKRNDFRAMLNEFELKYPGTKFSIINFFQTIKKKIQLKAKENKGKLLECINCSQPSNTPLCNSCSNLEKLLKAKEAETITVKEGKSCNELKELAT